MALRKRVGLQERKETLALTIKRRPGIREGIPIGRPLSACWAVRKTSLRGRSCSGGRSPLTC
jgi:hypothetical protein